MFVLIFYFYASWPILGAVLPSVIQEIMHSLLNDDFKTAYNTILEVGHVTINYRYSIHNAVFMFCFIYQSAACKE